MKRTKIIATLGPSTDEEGVLEAMVEAGLNVVRLNFSHGRLPEHLDRIAKVKELSKSMGRNIGILADLPGPKIRIGTFKNDCVQLTEGQDFTLVCQEDDGQGDTEHVTVDFLTLATDAKPGQQLLFDDGRLSMHVKSVDGNRLLCEVDSDCRLSNRKGINLYGGGLSAGALTTFDRETIPEVVKAGVHYIALSFVKTVGDVEEARKLIGKAGGQAGIIVKIERAEALADLDKIVEASDGVMVARGDLGVEIGMAEVPVVQKQIIRQARVSGKPIIIATQMMESMVHSPMPTRAEISDVANAVLDGTDAVMLSAESAVGRYPVNVVQAMAETCISVEKHPTTTTPNNRFASKPLHRIDEAVAVATMFTASHLRVCAIIALTESGSMPLTMSRYRSGIPIFALSRHDSARGRMSLLKDVYPLEFSVTDYSYETVANGAIERLRKEGYIHEGDWVILTRGDSMGVIGESNEMKILQVPPE